MKRSFLLTSALLVAASLGLAADQPLSSIHVEVHGTGAPVILIPGLGCSAEVWNETVVHLNAQGFQTYAVTLAGFGGTAPIHSDHLLETVRDDLASYIRQQHLSHPVVVGHSLGGSMALWLGAQYPDLTGKIVSVDGLPFLAGVMNPSITPDGARTLAQTIRQSMLAGSDEDYQKHARETVGGMITSPANVDRELKVDLSSDRATVAQAMAELLSTDLRPELVKIKSPVLLLGSWISYKDYGATHDSAAALYRSQFANMPGVQVTMSDTARHFIQLDSPEWFYSQVDAFLKQ